MVRCNIVSPIHKPGGEVFEYLEWELFTDDDGRRGEDNGPCPKDDGRRPPFILGIGI